MIKIDNVSMKFNLGVEKDNSLKRVFIKILSFGKKRDKKEYFWALKNVNIDIEKGEVIGISQSIYNPDNNISNIGIGFAIPVDEAKQFISSVKY